MAVELALQGIFGVKDHLTLGQECARAVLIFAYGLVILRVSGRRTFGKWSALDIVVSIISGSALSRALTGNAALPGTLAAVTLLVLLHIVISHAVAKSAALSRLIEGPAVVLARDGRLDEQARLRHMISESDLCEALRRHQIEGLAQIGQVKLITLEPNGTLNVLKASG